MSKITIFFDRCIVVDNNNSGSETFKVVVLGWDSWPADRPLKFVEVYDSYEVKFEVVEHLPRELMLAARNT